MQRIGIFHTRLFALVSGALVVAGLLSGCDLADPEVVVVNMTAENILLKNVSFRGALWEGVVEYGESSPVARCLPGRDRVHFQKLVLTKECDDSMAEDADVETGDLYSEFTADDSLPSSGAPNWFNYQSVTVVEVRSGDYRVLEIRLDDMEQDFTTPGPYGH